ncbi:hypothetical protein [Kitasatospora sp. NPDC088346]|uniref:hypothetical protein n=1 Tax=Kitasatospora sp. NPDC088346 TaxID=3364073 RepID=UPI003810573F
MAHAPSPGPRHRALVNHLLRLKRASGASFRELARRTEELAAADASAVALSASTLSRAVSGAGVPARETVEMFALAASPPLTRGPRPGPDREPEGDVVAAGEQHDDDHEGGPEGGHGLAAAGGQGDLQPTAPPPCPAPQHAGELPECVREACRLWERARFERAPGAGAGRYRRPHRVRTLADLGEALSRMRAGLTYRDVEARTARAGHRIGRSRAHAILAGLALPTAEQMAVLLAVFGVTRGAQAWMGARERLADPGPTSAPGDEYGYGCFDGHPELLAQQDRRENHERIKARLGPPPRELDPYEQELADQEERERRALERRLDALAEAQEMDTVRGAGGGPGSGPGG